HEFRALATRVEAEHRQFTVEIGQAEDCLERGGLAGAVRTDQADDAARFDVEVDGVERLRSGIRLGQVARTHDRVHRLSSSWPAASSMSWRRLRPRRVRRAYSSGHSSVRKRSRSDLSKASRAPSVTYMPSPLRFSTRFSSTSS